MSKEIESTEEEFVVDTTDEFGVLSGENLPNHSTSMQGRGKFVRVAIGNPTVRTKQAAYRLAARIVGHAQSLPDEDVPHTWDEVLDAVVTEMGVEIDDE